MESVVESDNRPTDQWGDQFGIAEKLKNNASLEEELKEIEKLNESDANSTRKEKN